MYRTKEQGMATLALAIGDCSAVVLLKQAIESARSPDADCWLHIGRNMVLEQRLRAIYHLGIRRAHLRIARWLHIYKLYDELARSVGGRDVDDFVILTSMDQNQTPQLPRSLVRRGKICNIEKAIVTTQMAKHVGDTDGGCGNWSKTERSLNRLRRIGERLQVFVNIWGHGILCLLGTDFTEEL